MKLQACAAALLLLAEAVVAQRDATPPPALLAARQRARETYAAARWPRGAPRAGCALGEFAIPGLTGLAPELLPPDLVCRRYVDAAGAPRVRVELRVADATAAAQDQLLDWLATRTAPHPAPTAASVGCPVGDVGYCGIAGGGPDRVEWVAFARGNLALRVLNLDRRGVVAPDVATVAQALDAVCAAAPLLTGSDLPPRPRLGGLSAEREHCRAGAVLRLELPCDGGGAAPLLTWEVGGPGQGQGYVEPDAAGRWQLHTTGVGPLTITVWALGPRGTVARASLQVRVE